MLVGVVTTVVGVAALAVGAVALFSGTGDRSQPPPAQSLAWSFAVFAGSTVNNSGMSVINGDVGGAKTGNAITGFPPGIVNGMQHPGDARALEAKVDTSTAYFDAANRTPDGTVPQDVGGLTLSPGVYSQTENLSLTGTLTLDGTGDSDAQFILQAGGTLATAVGSTVVLINGARACNVFWQVGESAALSADTAFAGSVLADGSVTVQTGATVTGRLLTRTGAVNLDSNTITSPDCASQVIAESESSANPKDTAAGSGTTSAESTEQESNLPGPTVPRPTTAPGTTGSGTTQPTPTDTTTETTPTETTTTETSTSDPPPPPPDPVPDPDPPPLPPLPPPPPAGAF